MASKTECRDRLLFAPLTAAPFESHSRLYLNSARNAAEILACYCTLQLTAPSPPAPASPTPTASLLSKASAAFGFGGGRSHGVDDSEYGCEDVRAERLRRAMAMVPSLDDKTQFFTPFGVALAARLVTRSSFSTSLERLALSLVRHVAPYELASKLHRMLADATVSRELSTDFAGAPGGLARLSSFLSGTSSTNGTNGTNGTSGADRPRGSAYNFPRIEIEVLVLTAGAWPACMPPPSAEILPPELATLQADFVAFYSTLHPSRQLAWLHSISTVEIATVGMHPRDRTLRVTPAQLAVLLTFTRGPTTLTIAHVAASSRLHPQELIHALQSLTRARLITCAGDPLPEGSTPSPPPARPHAPIIADGSASPRAVAEMPPVDPKVAAAAAAAAMGLETATASVRLAVAWTPSQRVAEGDIVPIHLVSSGSHRSVNGAGGTVGSRVGAGGMPGGGGASNGLLSAEDTRVVLHAAIVRTLKRAGKMAHAELLEQLTLALAPRLVPEVSSVRRAIEYLIDKEFVARHDADREIYVYVP